VKDVVVGMPDKLIGAPPGHEDDIIPLPATIGKHHSGMPLIVSRWHPTEDERQAIAAGGDIFLTAFSSVMIPVMLTTAQPIAIRNANGPVILTPAHPDYETLTAPPGFGG
jgi:hypothetical protein